jgi:hypothetical protein
MTLSKSDFRIFLQAPVHLWAKKHGHYQEIQLSEYEQHLINQGYEVEQLAQTYLSQALITPTYTLNFQSTVKEDIFHARLDALGFDEKEQVYDIYEVKSTSEVKQEQIYDAGFQYLVAQKSMPIRSVNLVILNKEYARNGELVLNQLFQIIPVTDKIHASETDLKEWMQDAKDIVNSKNPDLFDTCTKPKECPCLDICHPNLPDYSIYDIARIHKNKASQLKEEGIQDIHDIPNDFPLTHKQTLQVQAAKTGKVHIDTQRIKNDLAKLEYPLYFLDYETFNCALPLYEGYHPHQHLTFQYSLHIVPNGNGALHDDTQVTHKEFLVVDQEDPGRLLVEKMKQDISDTGSVLVWNKTFECGRNKEMANLYPEFADYLTNLNGRVYDLGDPFSKCWYVDPKFKGSWSIKNVLPVLVPELTYDGLSIGKGDQAMLAWWKMIYGDSTLIAVANGHKQPPQLNQDVAGAMLKYCELDTWAMVKIWRRLKNL